MQKKRDDITKALLEMVQSGRCEERYMDSVYDAVDMLNAHKDEPETGKTYLCLDDIQKFPIRRDHCDRVNGDGAFIFGVETVMEYINKLPRYKIAVLRSNGERCRKVKCPPTSPP